MSNRDELEPLSPLSLALLELERDRQMPPELQDAVWIRLSATLGLPPLIALGSVGLGSATTAGSAGASASAATAGTAGTGIATSAAGTVAGAATPTVVSAAGALSTAGTTVGAAAATATTVAATTATATAAATVVTTTAAVGVTQVAGLGILAGLGGKLTVGMVVLVATGLVGATAVAVKTVSFVEQRIAEEAPKDTRATAPRRGSDPAAPMAAVINPDIGAPSFVDSEEEQDAPGDADPAEMLPDAEALAGAGTPPSIDVEPPVISVASADSPRVAPTADTPRAENAAASAPLAVAGPAAVGSRVAGFTATGSAVAGSAPSHDAAGSAAQPGVSEPHSAPPTSPALALASPRGTSPDREAPSRASSGTAKHAAASDPTEESSSLEQERQLLTAARAALSHDQAADALLTLKQHEREHPRGQLAEERESLWIQALVKEGRGAEAHARADRFRRRYPRSLFLLAVEATLESAP